VSGDQAALPSLPPIELAGVAVTALAGAQTAGGPRLWATDSTGPALHAFAIPPGQDPAPLSDPLDLPAAASALAASDDGRFIFVLTAGPQPELRVVDAQRLEEGAAGALGARLAVAGAGTELAAAPSALYVPFRDPPAMGVAVIEVVEQSCGELFKRTIEGCPACAADDGCVVLATVRGYRPGERVSSADLDNLSDRRLLPSTEVITEVVRCLLERGGPRGPAGPPGPQGPPGAAARRPKTGVVSITAAPGQQATVTVTHGLGNRRVAVMLALDLEQTDRFHAFALNPVHTQSIELLRADVPNSPYDGKFVINLLHVANQELTYKLRWWAFAE
jgi:hypothetical protein